MNDVFADEIIGNADSVGKDLVQNAHARLGLVDDPLHVLVLEVEQDGDVVGAEDGLVVVEIFTLEGVGDHGLVLHRGDVAQPGVAQRQDGPFELPGRGVGAGEWIVPGDVVLEDGGLAGLKRVFHPRQIAEADAGSSSRMVSGLTLRTATLLRFAMVRLIYFTTYGFPEPKNSARAATVTGRTCRQP